MPDFEGHLGSTPRGLPEVEITVEVKPELVAARAQLGTDAREMKPSGGIGREPDLVSILDVDDDLRATRGEGRS